jgi:hypothetical protein
MNKSTWTATHGRDEKCTLDFVSQHLKEGTFENEWREHILTVMKNVMPCSPEETADVSEKHASFIFRIKE